MPLVYPYNFAPFSSKPPSKSKPPSHDVRSGHSGTLSCKLEVLTPLLIKDENAEGGNGDSPNSPYRPMEHNFKAIVPGTSLKGMVRSVFEVLANSCVGLSSDGARLIPNSHEKCNHKDALCPACQVFGFVGGNNGNVHKGLINIGQATMENRVQRAGPYHLPALYGANITLPDGNAINARYYGTERNPNGRKFYLHHRAFEDDKFPHAQQRRDHVQPLGEGSLLRFDVQYENLRQEHLDALVAALTLSDTAQMRHGTVKVRHKLGYGKPAGLGSVAISIEKAALQPSAKEQYCSFGQQANKLSGSALNDWVREKQDAFFSDPTDPVKALSEVLAYPPPEDREVAYAADPPIPPQLRLRK